MNKTIYINEINSNIQSLNINKLKEISNFIKYLKYQDSIDPTLEILNNQSWFESIQQGLKDIENGDVVSWKDIK